MGQTKIHVLHLKKVEFKYFCPIVYHGVGEVRGIPGVGLPLNHQTGGVSRGK
jgi:hypothetical protein